MRISEKEHSKSRGQQKNIAAKSKYESLQETTKFLLFFFRSVAKHTQRERERDKGIEKQPFLYKYISVHLFYFVSMTSFNMSSAG